MTTPQTKLIQVDRWLSACFSIKFELGEFFRGLIKVRSAQNNLARVLENESGATSN